MAEQPIRARISKVETAQRDGVHGESVMLKFQSGKEIKEEDFGSPLLNEENLFLWRRMVLSVVSGEKIPENDRRITDFENYKAALEQKETYIAYDQEENIVYAIGIDPKNMFFPQEYGLWM